MVMIKEFFILAILLSCYFFLETGDKKIVYALV